MQINIENRRPRRCERIVRVIFSPMKIIMGRIGPTEIAYFPLTNFNRNKKGYGVLIILPYRAVYEYISSLC